MVSCQATFLIAVSGAECSGSDRYVPYEDDEKVRIRGEVHRMIAPRDQRYQSNFVEVTHTPPCPLPLPALTADPRAFAVPEPQAGLPPLRRPVLLLLRRLERQRAHLARGHSPLCRDPRYVDDLRAGIAAPLLAGEPVAWTVALTQFTCCMFRSQINSSATSASW